MNQFAKLIRFNREDLRLCSIVLGVVFALTHIITALAVRLSGEGTSLLLSGILLPVCGGILMLILSIGHVNVTYTQSVRFGQTRKWSLLATLGVILYESLFVFLFSLALTLVERLLAPRFWLLLSGREFILGATGMEIIPGSMDYYRNGIALLIEDFTLDWWMAAVIILGAAIVGFSCGAIIHRFGQKGGWVLWGCWMVFFLFFQNLPWKTHTVTDWLVPALVITAAAAFLWSIRYLLRASIRN